MVITVQLKAMNKGGFNVRIKTPEKDTSFFIQKNKALQAISGTFRALLKDELKKEG